ncbi:hypothetical protein O181_001045 [Austropuccinia psidii MF-1]|uniref:Retrovirus-related Pol polyprotein from transposon TNT 1-94-like beta-barrel domain-containing protein n=1 Tax=Austropuccinia psidii MF-1 TaxID=1389203 RepID=A0A9Q3B9Y5_9BASI|nr:hypothetical protein [Austropuccinia psidii MF-1]
MALTIKNIDIFLKPDWISSLPNDTPEEEVELFQNSCQQIYFYLGNTLDQENYGKCLNDDQENYNPAALWLNIRDFYAASSVENCAAVMIKLCGMKMEDRIVSNYIIEIWHQSKLLKSMRQDLFKEKTMSCMLAFYYLRNLPTSLSFVKNNIYQEIKISKHVPTLESLLSDIELALARNQELSIPDGQALCVGERRVKCKNGKRSPEASHSQVQCLQLQPHLLKKFRERRNQFKHSKVNSSATESTGLKPMSSPRVYCISTESKRISFIKEEHAIIDSGASHSLFKDSERFVSFTKTRVALNQANGIVIYAEGFGTTAITGYKGSIIHLENFLIVPKITTPLISSSSFLRKGCSLSGKGESVHLFDEENTIILEGKLVENFISIILGAPALHFTKESTDVSIVHQALGHPSNRYETSNSSEEESSCLGSTSFAPISNAFSETSITYHFSPLIETGPPLDIDNSIPSSSFQTATEFNQELFDDSQEYYSLEDVLTHPSQNPSKWLGNG